MFFYFEDENSGNDDQIPLPDPIPEGPWCQDQLIEYRTIQDQRDQDIDPIQFDRSNTVFGRKVLVSHDGNTMVATIKHGLAEVYENQGGTWQRRQSIAAQHRGLVGTMYPFPDETYTYQYMYYNSTTSSPGFGHGEEAALSGDGNTLALLNKWIHPYYYIYGIYDSYYSLLNVGRSRYMGLWSIGFYGEVQIFKKDANGDFQYDQTVRKKYFWKKLNVSEYTYNLYAPEPEWLHNTEVAAPTANPSTYKKAINGGVCLNYDGTVMATGDIGRTYHTTDPSYGSMRGGVDIWNLNSQTNQWDHVDSLSEVASGQLQTSVELPYYGETIDMNDAGDRIVVGARNDFSGNHSDGASLQNGSIYVYENVNGTWQKMTNIKAPAEAGTYTGVSPDDYDSSRTSGEFGQNVSISSDGNTIMTTFNERTSPEVGGSIHIYKYENGQWSLSKKIGDESPQGDTQIVHMVGYDQAVMNKDGNYISIITRFKYTGDYGLSGDPERPIGQYTSTTLSNGFEWWGHDANWTNLMWSELKIYKFENNEWVMEQEMEEKYRYRFVDNQHSSYPNTSTPYDNGSLHAYRLTISKDGSTIFGTNVRNYSGYFGDSIYENYVDGVYYQTVDNYNAIGSVKIFKKC